MRERRIRVGFLAAFGLLATAALALGRGGAKEEGAPLWEVLARLRQGRFVDLTHAFGPGAPHWGGAPDEAVETLYDFEPGGGSMGKGLLMHRYSLVGQWGTHVDPPAHFVKGLRTVDQIDVREMLLPLVVLDLHEAVAKDPDATPTLDDVRGWERRHGPIPAGSFVALRTDWSKRWPDPAAMRNLDAQGVSHTPGWGREVLRYLFEDCKAAAIGHETLDTDPGSAGSRGDYALEAYVLGRDKYQIEALANLDQVPESGAIVVAAFPKPRGGSGFPARVFAIAP
ncbi:cyclase family protein [Paludisphaera mucosa]|uniref:Cyclase family protein n=1 Tax=Paludisphaera mucosa TaxID=3030827 RepID=A0ABT6FB48_9BACT|nr:cyclase family protein [Paludisphaera mucosa]MDG3004669.1 cyclase family protein [Paludisphaera mucosa]